MQAIFWLDNFTIKLLELKMFGWCRVDFKRLIILEATRSQKFKTTKREGLFVFMNNDYCLMEEVK